MIDSCDIDFRPSVRRSNGGLSGIESRMVFRGDLGSPESNATESVNNQQTTAQGGGAGSATIVLGAETTGMQKVSSGGGAAGIVNDLNVTTNTITDDPQLIGMIATGAQNDIEAAYNFASIATATDANVEMAANNNVSQIALGAENNSADLASVAIGANTTVTTTALNNEEKNIQNAYNFASGITGQIEESNAQLQGISNDTIETLAGDLGAVGAAAVGATPVMPITGGVDVSAKSNNWLILAGLVTAGISVYVFVQSKGKSA